MAKFLVETYAPRETATGAVRRVEDLAQTAGDVSQTGTEVRFLWAMFAPEEETCFYLFESSSADAIREAARCARLSFERITEAISIAAPAAHPGNPQFESSAE